MTASFSSRFHSEWSWLDLCGGSVVGRGVTDSSGQRNLRSGLLLPPRFRHGSETWRAIRERGHYAVCRFPAVANWTVGRASRD